MRTRLLALICGLIPFALSAGDTFKSGPESVALVELFTSEGCSSCPPADRWISGLRDEPGLWRNFVPVGWHVDYWDGLGWADVFASRRFTERQRSYAREWRESSVYTPAMVLGGKPWSGWRRGALPTPGRKKPAGTLEAVLAGDGTLTIAFAATDGSGGPWVAHAAILGSGLRSDVKAGENRGRDLRHDFTVLQYVTGKMPGTSARLRLERKAEAGGGRRALAVWLTRPGSMRPIQATGGWLAEE